MLKNSPDWWLCLVSRTWGVPIALFINKETEELQPRNAAD